MGWPTKVPMGTKARRAAMTIGTLPAAHGCSATVVTGERWFYGNVLIKKRDQVAPTGEGQGEREPSHTRPAIRRVGRARPARDTQT